MTDQHIKQTLDGAVGGYGVSIPFWIDYVKEGLEIVALAGGLVLLAMRLWIAWRELREKKSLQQK